jgi:hypothetical protein
MFDIFQMKALIEAKEIYIIFKSKFLFKRNHEIVLINTEKKKILIRINISNTDQSARKTSFVG